MRDLIVAAAIGLALLGLQEVRISKEKAAHQQTKTNHAEVLKDLSERTTAAYKAVLKQNDVHKDTLAALDLRLTGELKNEKDAHQKLVDDVRNGRVGLRVNAKCTTSTGNGVSKAPSTSGMDDASSPRLTDSAERDYFTLQDQIIVVKKQVIGLQSYINTMCLK